MEIRSFAETDSIPHITQLLHRAYGPLAERGMRYLASHQSEALTDERVHNGETYVAVEDGVIVATITVRKSRTPDVVAWYTQPYVATMEQFAVEPRMQGQGIGRALMDLAERVAKEWGATEMALDTSENATELIAMYTRRGYRKVAQIDRDVTNYRSFVFSKTL